MKPVGLLTVLLTGLVQLAAAEAGSLPGSAGIIEREQLTALVANLSGPQVQRRYREVHSLLVAYRGQLLVERYFRGNSDSIDFTAGVKRVAGRQKNWARDDLHYVASVTKGVTALLAGIALEELGLDARQKVFPLLSERQRYRHASWAGELTLRHLLSMQAGFVWDEWQAADLVDFWRARDFAGAVLTRENAGAGKSWRYNSALPNLVLTVLQAALQQPLRQWADRRFFQPLGIEHYRWDTQPDGTPEGAARLYLRPLDMYKIGQLVMDKGQWKRQQIVPAAWVAEMTRDWADGRAEPYGYYLWLREINGHRYISFEGDGGQYINVFPDRDLVIVITQGNYLDWPFYRHQAEGLMSEIVTATAALTK